jgi:4a-hydroxytetrahydrobiopterin dehydratase
MTADLLSRHCVPCEGGTKPLERAVAESYHTVTPEWELDLNEPNKLTRKFKFKDFAQAMKFINRVADVAEAEGHHPDFSVSWNRVSMELTTHAIGGLSENDFIMAAKINDLEGVGRA